MTELTPGQNTTTDTNGFQLNIVNSSFQDTVGAVLLAVVALILAFALMRSRRQNRKLLDRIRSTNL